MCVFSPLSLHSVGLLFRFSFVGAYPTLDMSNARDWDKFQYRARHLVGAIKGMGSSAEWPDLLGHVTLNRGVSSRAALVPNPQDPASRLGIFARTSDFVSFPHLSRHPLPAAAKLNGGKRAWGQIQEQVREEFGNPEWYHKDPAGEFGIFFAQLFHRIGHCRFPLHMAPQNVAWTT